MYVPAWELLSDALGRVLASGLDEQSAKTQLCQAIGDGAIAVRVTVAATDRDIPNRERTGQTVAHPSKLIPDDLDWQASKPLHLWNTGPDPVERASQIWSGRSWDWRLREIATVELFTDDVVKLFPPQFNSFSEADKPFPKRHGGRKSKYQWDRPLEALRQRLVDDGVPAPGDGGQAELEKYVADQFLPENCPSETMIREKVRHEIATYRIVLGQQGR